MAKFTAPAHVAEIMLASGPLAVVDGLVEIHEPTDGDIIALRSNGFELVAEGAYFALPAAEPERGSKPAASEPEAPSEKADDSAG